MQSDNNPPRPADPFRPADDAARELAHALIGDATHAALAVQRPGTTAPSVTRIALATDDLGTPVTLISTLAEHTAALQANPACALLIGQAGDKGDPLTHPRLTLHCRAMPISRSSPEHATLRKRFVTLRPKAKLYVDFADFSFVRFQVQDGLLNGGFGKAWRLSAADLGGTQRTT